MSTAATSAATEPQQEEKKRKKQEIKEVGTGLVKSVLSGDRLVIYCDSKVKKAVWSPPEEREIKLSGIKAPLPYAKWEGGERPEEPFAWDSRDFLRSICIGKPVEYAIFRQKKEGGQEKKGGREFGSVRLRVPLEDEEETDLSRLVVKNGWAVVPPPPSSVSDKSNDKRPESVKALLELEAQAKELGLGLHSRDREVLKRAVPIIDRDFDEKELYTSSKGQTLAGIVERVHSGSTLSILLVPSFREILLKIAGVQSPAYRQDPAEREPFALEAKFTTERYLLQRKVDVVFTAFEAGRESTRSENKKDRRRQDNKATYYGEVLLNGKSIGELLLKSGLATFVEWHAPKDKASELLALQTTAQEQRIRMWFSEQALASARKTQAPSSFTARVKEVNTATSLVVLNLDVNPHRLENVTLSSVQVNRLSSQEQEYDGFFAYEAREFVRKKLLGRKVEVTVDYVKPAVNLSEVKRKDKQKGQTNGKEEEEEDQILPEKAFHTVLLDGKNIALALVELGYATVMEHRGGAERSPHYDALFLAQERAMQRGVGLHGTPDKFVKHRTNDVSRSPQRAKALLNSLMNKNNGKYKAVVEYVFSGSRLKLCINPDGPQGDSILILFFLDGVRCESLPNQKQLKEGKTAPPFALEAREFARDWCYQRDVDIQILGQDKFGAFRGHLLFNKKNLALLLLKKGYAKTNRPRDFAEEYLAAEDAAKQDRLNIWRDYDPVKEAEERQKRIEDVEAASKPRKELMVVTEVLDGASCYVQIVGDDQKRLEAMMKQIAQLGLDAEQPFSPSKDEAVLAKFSGDQQWYRAKVLSADAKGSYKLVYADYGNTEAVESARIRRMRPEFGPQSLAWQAHEACLAYIQPRSLGQEYGEDAALLFKDLVWGKTLMATIEYTDNQRMYLSFIPMDNKDIFVNGELVRAGLAKVQKRLPRGANREIVEWLRREQEDAFKAHRGIWEYGDDGEDDDEVRDFGARKRN